MNLRSLSLSLLVVGCGGGKDPIILVDAPDTGPGVFPNSANDMVYVGFAGMEFAAELSPGEDSPDNQAAPLAIAGAASKRVDGVMGFGGNHMADDYHERDTYLITTGADVNQLTVRLAWDGEAADLDFVLFNEAGDAEPVRVASGTLISNVNHEFQTFVVEPNTNYWLWAGVYGTNADDGAAPGGSPTLPLTYDFSIYGQTFAVTDVGTCNFTELADATNDTLSTGATGVPETSGQSLATATSHVFCGAINSTHFVPDAADPSFGIVDADSFTLTVSLATPMIVTLTGVTVADQVALAGLLQVEYYILDKDGAFFDRGFFTNTHGTLTSSLPTTIDDMGMETGPKSIAIIAANGAAIPANIDYKIKIASDDPLTRGPRLTTASDLSEANDE